MFVCLSVCLSPKISVTTEPIGFYSSGNIPTGPVVVLGYFLGIGTLLFSRFYFLQQIFSAPLKIHGRILAHIPFIMNHD